MLVKDLADTALKTANSGYLTRRLVDVAQESTIVEEDCLTLDGIIAEPLMDGGEIIVPLGDEYLAGLLLMMWKILLPKQLLLRRGRRLPKILSRKLSLRVSTVLPFVRCLSCRSKRGVCAACYGRDLGRGHMVNRGEAIGVIAAQSIGEPGTQLTMRTFHVGGTASRSVEQAELKTNIGGTVAFQICIRSPTAEGTEIVMNRNAVISVKDDLGRERERFKVNYGAQLLVKEGEAVARDTILADWDAYTIPIVAEVGGTIKYGDVIEGITMQEKVDAVTGRSSLVIIHTAGGAQLSPRITVKNERGKTVKMADSETYARYSLPVGSIISVNEGDHIQPGTIVGKIPRETTKTKDITGGLPRVAELFEVRKPKDPAIIAKIDGKISFGKELKGKRRVVVTPEYGEPQEYLSAKGQTYHRS